MKQANSYLDQLTWLRGFAAFLVIISHTIRATEVTYYDGDLQVNHGIFYALDLGTFGVLLFFSLSGCTLYISNAAKLRSNNISGFYIKRFFRIWPAFAVSIIGYLLFRFIFQQYYDYQSDHWIEGQFLDVVGIKDVVGQILLISNFTDASLVNNAYWSLPVEFQYYLIFPLLILATRYAGAFGPVLIGIFLYFLPKIIPINTTQVFVLALSFCGGVSVGYLYEKMQFRFSAILGFVLCCLCLLLVSFNQLTWIMLPDVIYISNVWNFYSVIAVFLVFIVSNSHFYINKKVASFLKYYGEISYSTYLYHNLVIGLVMLFLLHFKVEGYLRFYTLLFSTLLITHFIAKYSHRFIERPCTELGRKYSTRYERIVQQVFLKS